MQIAISESNISWEAAARITHAAVEYGRIQGLKVCAAVVDRNGSLISLLRIPGAPFHSTDIATDKAYTAASFGLATGEWAKVLPQHSAAVQQGVPLRPRMVLFGGGIPVIHEGHCVGAVGVSGATEEQDVECARKGLEAVAGMVG
ncbi:MAG: GlcG/HbpS family heme-binding protein [Panacagrimonas sp.]